MAKMIYPIAFCKKCRYLFNILSLIIFTWKLNTSDASPFWRKKFNCRTASYYFMKARKSNLISTPAEKDIDYSLLSDKQNAFLLLVCVFWNRKPFEISIQNVSVIHTLNRKYTFLIAIRNKKKVTPKVFVFLGNT